ncbi:hypothetical protein [Profundibacter sp.]
MKTGIFAALLVAASCVSSVTMDQAMQSWQGANINQVIEKWGYPHDEKTVAGLKQYSWTDEFTPISDYINGKPQHTFTCTRTLVVSASGKIVEGRSSGNNCPFDASKFTRN